MGRLGNSFPKTEKNEYVNRQLKGGQVLYLFCGFTNPRKEKYLVLACPGSKPLLFIINSRIHPFVAKHPHLLKCQVKLEASDYRFLHHDSFVDCSKVIDFFHDSQIRGQILDDISRVKGELSTNSKRKIIQAVQSAKTVSPKHKRKIISSLK